MESNTNHMRKVLKIGALTVLVMIGIGIGIGMLNRGQVNAQEKDTKIPQTIAVQGTAEKYGKPSIAHLNIGVLTQGDTMEAAQSANTPLIDAVIAEVKAQGVAEKDIQTSGFNVYPRYDNVNYSQIIGYEVTHTLSVTVRDIEKAGAVLDAAFGKGANQSHGINFDITTEEREALYNEAMKEAVKQGEMKAKILAESIGATIGKPLQVNEGSQSFVNPMLYPSGAGDGKMAEFAATSIQPGELTVTATVTLVYEGK